MTFWIKHVTDLHCFQLHLLRTREFKMTPKARSLRLQEAQAKYVKKQMKKSSCSLFCFYEWGPLCFKVTALSDHSPHHRRTWAILVPVSTHWRHRYRKHNSPSFALLWTHTPYKLPWGWHHPPATLSPHHVLQWSQTPILTSAHLQLWGPKPGWLMLW